MILKKHFINIWLRVIGILITCLAIAYVSIPNPDWFFIINLLILLFIQIFLFVRSQNVINRELEYLFDSIESSETSITFSKKLDKVGFQNIYNKFDDLIKHVQELKVDSLQKNVYLTTLFEHINVGIITIKNKGIISLKNSSARKILGKGNINNIDDIHKIDTSFASILKDIKPEESKLITFYNDGYLQHLLVRAAQLKFPDEDIRIISFQNIRGELDEREMEGWQKLIRVLTHELMNTVGPINSTISTILDLLIDKNKTPINVESITPDIVNDAIKGIKIIEERSKGMLDFVKRFRSLTLIPHPEFVVVNIDQVINNIITLLQDEAEKSGIVFTYKTLYSNLKAYADKGMTEQILINLLKNSIRALKDNSNPVISISSWSDNSNTIYINVVDNGKGVPSAIQNKIFVPFYTTYKQGTGIGLSLSRQLANVQGGSLALTKSTDGETIFTLKIKMAN
jgi:nitrogen fixation/metabolism regulation signal transduction histidine kinase